MSLRPETKRVDLIGTNLGGTLSRLAIAASGTLTSPWMDVRYVDEIIVYGNVVFGSSIDANMKFGVETTYDESGDNVDTTAYDSFELTYSAGNTKQRGYLVNTKSLMWLRILTTNLSSADTATVYVCLTKTEKTNG